MVDAILFDFDLTLADSSAAVTECANYALRALGFEAAEPARVRQTIGLSLALLRALRLLDVNPSRTVYVGRWRSRARARVLCCKGKYKRPGDPGRPRAHAHDAAAADAGPG